MTNEKGIQIDIPNVTPEMKVSDLTVYQFVNLLVQVSEQLSASRAMKSPGSMEAIMKQISGLTAKGVGMEPSVIKDMVQQIQQAIRDKKV